MRGVDVAAALGCSKRTVERILGQLQPKPPKWTKRHPPKTPAWQVPEIGEDTYATERYGELVDPWK